MAETQSKHLSSVLESLRAAYGAEVFASAFSLMSSVKPSASSATPSAASSVASDPAVAPAAASSAAPKRRGPKKLADMTPEERESWEAKKAERKAKKAEAKAPSADGSATEPEDTAEAKPPTAEQKPKRGGRPKMTPEQKAEAKAKRQAKKAGGAEAEVVDLTSGLPEGWAALCSGSAKPDIGSFESCEIEGVSYMRNCRGDLLTPEGEWLGRMVAGKLDPSVPEPADLADVNWG